MVRIYSKKFFLLLTQNFDNKCHTADFKRFYPHIKQEQPLERANQLVQEADGNLDEADRLRQEAVLREMGL